MLMSLYSREALIEENERCMEEIEHLREMLAAVVERVDDVVDTLKDVRDTGRIDYGCYIKLLEELKFVKGGE